MRSGWLSGCGAAAGTMLLLVAAAMIAQPNIRVLDEAVSGFFDALGRNDKAPPVEAVVDGLTVDADRVRGRVRNPSSVTLGAVVVRVRLVPPEGGEGRTVSATVYGLAPGAEAWFGIPLVGGPRVAKAEVVDVQATAGAGPAAPSETQRVMRQQRRSGVGGMEDVQRMEQDMEQMEEAARAATGGH